MGRVDRRTCGGGQRWPNPMGGDVPGGYWKASRTTSPPRGGTPGCWRYGSGQSGRYGAQPRPRTEESYLAKISAAWAPDGRSLRFQLRGRPASRAPIRARTCRDVNHAGHASLARHRGQRGRQMKMSPGLASGSPDGNKSRRRARGLGDRGAVRRLEGADGKIGPWHWPRGHAG